MHIRVPWGVAEVPLEPKFQRRLGGPRLSRPFVDREELIDGFWQALGRKDLSKPKVLVYHGLGGIGKSRLRRELKERLQNTDPQPAWAEVDFSLPSLRDPETALFSLRRELRDQHNLHFPTFDLVYAYLWRLSRPNAAPYEQGRPLFEAGTLASMLIAAAGMPLAIFINKAAESGSKAVKAWWTKRGREDLQELTRLEPSEISERLPVYLAEDVLDYFEDGKHRLVLFFDTHEALLQDIRSEEQRLLRDEWLRELVLQLPPALFVILGREPLAWAHLDPEWESVLEQYEIRELPEHYCRQFLGAATLTDLPLQNQILKEAKGVPFLLDLTVDTVEEMERMGKELGAEELVRHEPQAEYKLAERFLRYLSPPEQATVEVLSIPRFFEEALFKDLVATFQTQLPLNQFTEICRFSFITERSPGIFVMHDLMWEALEARLKRHNPERLQTIHQFLFRRYDQKLEGVEAKQITPEHERALLEALYHAPQAVGLEQTLEWFMRRADIFCWASRASVLIAPYDQLVREAEEELGPHHFRTWAVFCKAAEANRYQGKREEAERLARRAVCSCEETVGPESPSLAIPLLRLGSTIYDSFGPHHIEKAEELARRSLRLLELDPGLDEHAYAESLQFLGFLCFVRGAFLEAENYCKAALELCRRINYGYREAWVSRDLAVLYDLGGWYTKGEEAYHEALDTAVRILGEGSGLAAEVQRDWAELKMRQGHFSEAEPRLKAALETWNRLDWSPAWSVEAYGTLAEVQIYQGKYGEAEENLREAAQLAETLVPSENMSRGWIQGLTGWLRVKVGRLEEGERLLEQAWELAVRVCPPGHSYLFPPLIYIGELRRRQGRYEQADEALREALEIVQTHLRPDHPRAGEILLVLATLRDEQGRTAEAEELRAQGRAMREKEGCIC
jgi:tetratricopeptide (TPR) repeat protein